MTKIAIKVGDVLEETADLLICPANPWLNLSGGVNGEMLRRDGRPIQEELRAYLRSLGKSSVQPGTIVVTSPGSLNVKKVIHAVAIDPFYDSSVDLVRTTVESALAAARQLGARTVVMPALATGYGHLSMEQFAEAFATATQADWSPVESLTVVVRTPENAAIVENASRKSAPWRIS